MSTVALHMPPHLATTDLATQVVDVTAPEWAASHSTVTLDKGLPPGLVKRRTENGVFRLPNSDAAVRAWLYSRPAFEAVGEDAFENAATESSTVFRMHPIADFEASIKISPTVSSHWLMVPVQSINGVTVGLAYLDVLYERPGDDARVPPLPVGKFAIEDATGEVFVTAWGEGIMIVGWIQSIIKCERVRELLMFEAPPENGLAPKVIIRRNSFYERRKCYLCGRGKSMSSLEEPCSGIGSTGRAVTDPAQLTNIATLYRRFRGAYFGVCLKTSYVNRIITEQILVPVFIDVRQGLHTVKQRFKNNLHRNVHFSLKCGMAEGLFGLSPRSSSRVFFLKGSQPVSSYATLMDSPPRRRRKGNDSWEFGEEVKMEAYSQMTCLGDQDSSAASSERSHSPPSRTRRRVGVDDIDRGSVEFERRRRNRIAAERSNQARKEKLKREKEELDRLRTYMIELKARRNELAAENYQLQVQAASREMSLG